jgi:ribosomal protein S18 acetylase RimI-like enzyme
MSGLFAAVRRGLRALGRPSSAANLRRLDARGVSLDHFVIREARVEDLPALARVHVTTWNATHRGWRGSRPSYDLRSRQWKEKLESRPDGWFCYVAESPDGSIVGFATGQAYAHHDLPEFDAQLAKIYLLAEYQRIKLGRRLFHAVARRHVESGRRAMVLFSQPDNPSCAFFEALGGERLLAPTGAFHGGYGWRNVAAVLI